MSRTAKLYERLVDGRALTFAEFQRLLSAFGFELDRTTGSHHIYRRPGIGDRVIAQPRGKAAKGYQLKQFLDIIEERGLDWTDDQ